MDLTLKNKLDEYDKIINNLKEEKVRKVYNAIKEVEKEYDNKISSFEFKKNNIKKVKYFDLEEAVKLINYLVNNMEEENYVVSSSDIIIYGHNLAKKEGLSIEKIPIKSRIVYLVKEENKNEVDLYFKRETEFTQEELDKDKKDYIQIAYFKDIDQKSICFENDSKPITNVISYISSRVYNYDKLYIVDFMNKLYKYKLDKYDENITYEDMITFADGYINTNKDVKKLINDKK